MGQSKLELAVGTGQWDAGLKKAQQALNSFTQAQGGLQQALAKDNGDMQKFIQMMGKMESTANTSKGQMNDYKRVLEQLTAQYNQMSDAQKNSIGQDYLQTIDALKQKFAQAKRQVDDFNRSLGETSNAKLPEISGGGGGLFSGGKFGGMLQVFGGNMMTKAAGLAASFASELGDAVSQGIELARAGEGIRIAFERLGRGDILDGLREATHGTVTDLELMKAAVKFNDFKLPLEELGTMLAFAQQKAKDTGQSVDYMVDSIVTGLGRKSLMILDNLGLSAAQIKDKMAETGDMTKAVGAIIREEMAKAGDYVETAADRATKANVEVQNAMTRLGETFQPLTDSATSMWTEIKVGALDLLNSAVKPLIKALQEAGALGQKARGNAGYENLGGDAKVNRLIANLGDGKSPKAYRTYKAQMAEFDRYANSLKFKIASYGDDKSGVAQSAVAKLQTELAGVLTMRMEYDRRAQELHKKATAKNIDTNKEEEQSIDSLKKKLTELQEQRKKAIAAGDKDKSKNLLQQINQVKADIRGLDPKALSTSTKTPKTEEQLNNEQIQKLTQEYIKATDDRRKAIEAEIKGLQQRNDEIKKLTDIAQGKVAPEGSLNALNEKLKELQTERGKLSDPIEIEIQDHQIKKVQDEIDRLNGKKVDVELEVNNLSSFEQLQQSLRIKIAEQNMEVDTNTLQTLMQTAIKNGIDSLDPDFASLQEKMREGMNIPDDTWKALQDQINAKLKELGIESIKIDFKTGNVANGGGNKSDVDGFKNFNDKFSQLNSGVGSIVSGIQQMGVEIPKELQSTLSVLQGISTIMTGVLAIITLMDAKQTAQTAMSFVPFFAHGGLVHAATGYMVPGNDHADRTLIAASSGELILNRAQQGVIAGELEGGAGRSVHVTGMLRGEDIVLVADRWGRRTGKGELAFWK